MTTSGTIRFRQFLARRKLPLAVLAAILLVATALLVAAARGGSSEPQVDAAPTVPSTTAAPPPTTTSTTTTSTTTTTLPPTTTVAPTTTVRRTTTTSSTSTTTTVVTVPGYLTEPIEQPSEPVPPPSDSYASEPIIEIGTISIPKIGVSMTMYEGIRMTTLDYGPGHWPGTAMPGQAGNVVVGGHRTSKHAVFRNVDQLQPGDEIIFEDANGRHVYAVNRVEIVDPTAVWIVDPTDTPQATLFACHPPGSTRQRIIVFSDLIT